MGQRAKTLSLSVLYSLAISLFVSNMWAWVTLEFISQRLDSRPLDHLTKFGAQKHWHYFKSSAAISNS